MRLKKPAWIRKSRVTIVEGEPLPQTAGGIHPVHVRLARKYWLIDAWVEEWEYFGWKPYDATVYRLRKYDPHNTPVEAVPLGFNTVGFEVYTTNLKKLVRGEAPAWVVGA